MTEAVRSTKRRKNRTVLIILIILLIMILLAFVLAFLIFDHYYRLASYEKEPVKKVTSIEDLPEDVASSLEAETLVPSDEQEILEIIRQDQEDARKNVNPEETHKSVKSYNILLIGVDRRDASWNGNSDAMILMTINYDKKKVTLTSFMRDSGVDIPGIGLRKLNHAYAVGGGNLLQQTLEQDFAVKIDNYAWVDFDGMKNVIDVLGGIDLKMSAQEAKHIGLESDGSTPVHLDGAHALRHARDRSSGGWDYMRTQRQRNVLMAIVNKAKSGGIGDLRKAAEAVLPYIHHNVDEIKMLSLLADMTKVIRYDFQEQRIPYDGLYNFQGEMLVPNFKETIERLYDTIY